MPRLYKMLLPEDRYSFSLDAGADAGACGGMRPPAKGGEASSTTSFLFDPRINFALNCGSRSCLATVPVYMPHRLEAQLTEVSQQYLSEFIKVCIR
jgi:hypothetical protein